MALSILTLAQTAAAGSDWVRIGSYFEANGELVIIQECRTNNRNFYHCTPGQIREVRSGFF